MGAPIGNNNAHIGFRWRQAINKALENRSRAKGLEELEALADKLIDLAANGDLGALKELGDRVEGKAVQAIAGHDHGPLVPAVDVSKLSTEVLSALMAAKE